ncbi:growth/differentiation factor 6-A [Salminus brasiliensis]|uniref:growth/differentiation factor 6-A n=1 Tax=Salminus brasiliensis TaxID=930266 RepID=UPI003B834C0A
MNRWKSGAPFFLCFALCFATVCEAAALLDAQPPRNGTSVHIPSYMMALYRTLSVLDRRGTNGSLARSRRHANTVTSFIDQGEDQPSDGSHQRYVFDLSGLSRTEELVEAELRVFRKPPSDIGRLLSLGGSMYRLLLYSCPCPGSSDRPLLLSSRTIDILDTISATWDVFDILASVKASRRMHRTARGSRLVCFSVAVVCDSTNEKVYPPLLGFGGEPQGGQERALLVAFSRTRRKENLFREIREKMKAVQNGGLPVPTVDRSFEGSGRSRRRRKRRTALAGRSSGAGGGGGGAGGGGTGGGTKGGGVGGGGGGGRRRTRCSRKPLHVNFKELGWDDWIIAPLDYEAYHCEGACDFPLRSHLEPTNHAIIQTLMNSMDPESTPPSCCVPSKLSPISILYIDSGNNVVYKQYEDMVVEQCGCR